MNGAIYRLMLRTHARRGRVLVLLLAGLVAVVVTAALQASDETDLLDTIRFLAAYGFALFVPVTTLAIASAMFGDLLDDQSLVYIWLRPVSRSQIVTATYAAAVTISLPIVLLPLGAAAAVTGDTDVVVGTLVAAAVAVVAYAAIFLALGLRTRRALLWGLAYILVWEGFVASIGRVPARLSVRGYARSILAWFTEVDLRLADETLAVAVLVPVLAAIAFGAYTTRRLNRMDVD
jgi:ABC-2 type transport system permease protein